MSMCSVVQLFEDAGLFSAKAKLCFCCTGAAVATGDNYWIVVNGKT